MFSFLTLPFLLAIFDSKSRHACNEAKPSGSIRLRFQDFSNRIFQLDRRRLILQANKRILRIEDGNPVGPSFKLFVAILRLTKPASTRMRSKDTHPRIFQPVNRLN